MLDLMYFFMLQSTQGEEEQQELEKELHRTSFIRHPMLAEKKKLKLVHSPEDKETKKIIPNKKWQAPEGWTPPGWDEQRSYQNALGFMKFQKGGK